MDPKRSNSEPCEAVVESVWKERNNNSQCRGYSDRRCVERAWSDPGRSSRALDNSLATTTTNKDRRERNYNNDATITQVGRSCWALLERSWALLSASGPSKGDVGSILVPPREISEPHRVDFDAGSSRAKLQQRCNNNESRACIMHASNLVIYNI